MQDSYVAFKENVLQPIILKTLSNLTLPLWTTFGSRCINSIHFAHTCTSTVGLEVHSWVTVLFRSFCWKVD